LESSTVLAKIENALGLDNSITTGKPIVTDILWSGDKQLLCDRWIHDRREHNKSEDFIKNRMNIGDNRNARLTFRFFQIMSVVLALLSILVLVHHMAAKI